MALNYRPGTPADLDDIARLLQASLHCSPDAPLVNREHMRWKYFHPRPESAESRSMILEDNGRIVAHMASVPGTILAAGRQISCAHFIDWAADGTAMSAGAALLRRLGRSVELTCCIGGSPDNQRLLPVLGFKPANEVQILYRPLRPLRQATRHPRRGARLPARALRNVWHALWPPLQTAGWTCRAADPADLPEALWNPPQPGITPHLRSSTVTRYFLDSPLEPFRFHILSDNGAAAGALLVCLKSGQARVADFWIDRPDLPRLRGALAAVMEAARSMEAEELVLSASTPQLQEAARQLGMRVAHARPIMMSPIALMASAEPLDAPLGIDDAAYLGGAELFYYS